MTNEIRVGIIGCGKIANVDHVPGYKSAKGVRITALHDVKAAQMAKLKAAQGLDAATYLDLDKFLASGLDAVSICTPNVFHCPLTLRALKAGLHVLCEKPMAASTPETTKMIETARKAGKVLQINQTLHYIPVYIKLAELVQNGAIGEPIHVRCLRAGGTAPDKGWSLGARWFVTKAFQGGIILDIGVHMAEMMRWAMGEVTHVAAFTGTRRKDIDVPDNVATIFRFKNGATGVLELSWTMPVGGGLFEVYGTKGALHQGFSSEHPIELRSPGEKGKPDKVTYPALPVNVKNSQQSFIEAILGKAKSPTPGELGREAIALCEAIAKSGETGKFVEVKRF